MTGERNPVTLDHIESLASRYADSRADLAGAVQALKDEIDEVKIRRMPGIRQALLEARTDRENLAGAIEAAPQLFVRPKTRVLHNIKVGYRKGIGTMKWADPQQVIKLIRKHMPRKASTLIKTSETPVKSALAQLSQAELKKIAVTIQETGDQIEIRPLDADVDKLIGNLFAADEIKKMEAGA